MKEDEIVRFFDRHSNEIATVGGQVTKYKHMRKLMLVFLGKFENRRIKIARVISNSDHQIYQFTLISMVLGVRYDHIFSTNCPCAVH